MTKEQYINSKTYNPLDVVYHYYVTHPKRNHHPLGVHEFFILMHSRGVDVNKITQNIMNEYDRKFNLVVILDKHGSFIKYL